MANVLLLDDNDVAGRALQGILARGHHVCLVATDAGDAWARLREAVVIDLVILELRLPGNAGMIFLQRLRDICFWKNLPVIVYTSAADPASVRSAVALKTQNFLIKPYNPDVIYAEIAKSRVNPWRNLHFEEAKSFCAQMGLTLDALAAMRRTLITRLEESAKEFPSWSKDRMNATVFERIDALSAEAEAAGVWVVVEYLGELRAAAEAAHWGVFSACGPDLEFAGRLIFCQLNPTHVPDCLRPEDELAREKETAMRARWLDSDIDANGPIVPAGEVEGLVGALPGCPVIDSVAAAFLMSADGRAQGLKSVMELVANDPGLSAQVLIAASKLEGHEANDAADPQVAVGLLGVVKLNALAKSMLVVPERLMRVPPVTWTNFWMFLVAVGKMGQFICDYLEFAYLRSNAYTAGMLHDLGKLVLARLYPFGFEAVVRHAEARKVPLHVAERKYLRCDTRQIAIWFAERSGLPRVYCDVIRWVETPELATENIDLVAIISLARHVCQRNHVGYCGDTPHDSSPPIGQTAAWQVLQPRLFPSFDLAKFEAQAHAFCLELRKELTGRRT